MKPSEAREWIKVLKEGKDLLFSGSTGKKKQTVSTKTSNNNDQKKTQGSFRKICLKGKVVVVTGTISVSRNEFERRLNNVEAKLGKSITGNTDFLIVGIKAGKKKLSDAKEKGIPVISWRDFVSMI
jgi:NAD-dependent DNA ligase